MGYRSDVVALIYEVDDAGPRYEALKLLIPNNHPAVAKYFAADLTYDDDSRMVVVDCKDVKWYGSYPDVQAFHAMLDDLEELGYAVEFARVGEDDDDTEIRRSDTSEYKIAVTRSISF